MAQAGSSGADRGLCGPDLGKPPLECTIAHTWCPVGHDGDMCIDGIGRWPEGSIKKRVLVATVVVVDVVVVMVAYATLCRERLRFQVAD